jgi:hypothetical protein
LAFAGSAAALRRRAPAAAPPAHATDARHPPPTAPAAPQPSKRCAGCAWRRTQISRQQQPRSCTAAPATRPRPGCAACRAPPWRRRTERRARGAGARRRRRGAADRSRGPPEGVARREAGRRRRARRPPRPARRGTPICGLPTAAARARGPGDLEAAPWCLYSHLHHETASDTHTPPRLSFVQNGGTQQRTYIFCK